LQLAELAFIETVAERAGVPEDQAVALIEATLRTLTERISAGEAADAAAHMPDRFRPLLIKSRENAEAFPIDEFIRRVAERAGVGPDVAERGVRAVLQTMRNLVGHKEFEDIMSQLPREFGELVRG